MCLYLALTPECFADVFNAAAAAAASIGASAQNTYSTIISYCSAIWGRSSWKSTISFPGMNDSIFAVMELSLPLASMSFCSRRRAAANSDHMGRKRAISSSSCVSS